MALGRAAEPYGSATMLLAKEVLRAGGTSGWRSGWIGALGAALESARSARAIAGIQAGLVLLVGIAAALNAPISTVPQLIVGTALTAIASALLLGVRPSSRMTVEVACTVALVALTTGFSSGMRPLAPTVIWLYAFVVPTVGIVRGPALGALAGVLSAPALHWIETGVPINLMDPQTPFGILILGALGAMPGQLLSVARARRQALDAQLHRVQGLLAETQRARESVAEAHQQAVFMLARAAEARDGTTGVHIEHVADLAGELALAAGVDRQDAEVIAWSAMLHDVGKLRVPDRVLLKPAPLDADEWGHHPPAPDLGRRTPRGRRRLRAGPSDRALAP